MDLLDIIIIVALLITVAVLEVRNQQNKSDKVKITEKMPYKKKLLLTKHEWSFYKSLKPVADELGYSVLAKIRVADLVEVTAKDRSEWQKYFNKVNKKHIDFVLAKPENLQIVLLIELDDNSHNEAQKQRDEFIEALYKQTGYKLLRTRGNAELKEKILSTLENSETNNSAGQAPGTVTKRPPIIQNAQTNVNQTSV